VKDRLRRVAIDVLENQTADVVGRAGTFIRHSVGLCCWRPAVWVVGGWFLPVRCIFLYPATQILCLLACRVRALGFADGLEVKCAYRGPRAPRLLLCSRKAARWSFPARQPEKVELAVDNSFAGEHAIRICPGCRLPGKHFRTDLDGGVMSYLNRRR
jgi:hypothetical protein